MIATILGWVLVALALAGTGYCMHALIAVDRFARRPLPPPAPPAPVSLLKPLHGAEPRLADNLATMLDQEWAAPIELVAGVQQAADPAIAVARGLATNPARTIELVIDATRHGANAKVANLINMLPAARHDLLVLSDSDIAVPRDYLAIVAGALAGPGVGAVTCLYRGRGDAGAWSVLAAAASSYQFLPNILVSLSIGDRRVCLGSTIALRRTTLDAIGGFEGFADTLADDAAIGAAVRALGREVAIPPLLLVHAATETGLAALVRHELRWMVTVREVVSFGEYAGLALTMPLAPALLALPLLPLPAVLASVAALIVRALLWRRIDRWAGECTAPLWLLPARDLLSFAIFLASFGARSVDWRGRKLRISGAGRIAPAREPIR